MKGVIVTAYDQKSYKFDNKCNKKTECVQTHSVFES